jgi:hypothetical protein
VASSSALKIAASRLLLVVAIFNFAVFCVVAIIGYHQGVSYPHFPAWFDRTTWYCFVTSLGLSITCLGLLIFKFEAPRTVLTGSIGFGTAMLIAFLTSRG